MENTHYIPHRHTYIRDNRILCTVFNSVLVQTLFLKAETYINNSILINSFMRIAFPKS